MAGQRGLTVLLVGCVCLACVTGCRNPFRRRSAGTFDDSVTPEDIEFSLPARGMAGAEVLGVQFEPVHFAYDSARIDPAERGKLETVADYLRRSGGVQLTVEGHCDERGSDQYNMALGERRALAVRAYLIGLGIGGERVGTLSYGEERPVDPGHGEAAWQQNRRAEFRLTR